MRAAVPIALIIAPRRPMRMPFWDSVSTHSSAWTSTRSSRSIDLVDLDLDRVRDLLARAVQHLLAHELGQPHVLGLVGDLLEREQERPLGRELDEVLDERADALAAGGGDREDLAVEAEVGGGLERLDGAGAVEPVDLVDGDHRPGCRRCAAPRR